MLFLVLSSAPILLMVASAPGETLHIKSNSTYRFLFRLPLLSFPIHSNCSPFPLHSCFISSNFCCIRRFLMPSHLFRSIPTRSASSTSCRRLGFRYALKSDTWKTEVPLRCVICAFAHYFVKYFMKHLIIHFYY